MFCHTVIQSSFRIVILMQVTPYDTDFLRCCGFEMRAAGLGLTTDRERAR
jgi:hypothetical protein